MNVRAAEAEIDWLAKIWYDGWQDAHTQIVPAEPGFAPRKVLETGYRQLFRTCE